MALEVHFLGSGDAFGSGGRLQTCILLRGGAGDALVDCGASSLIAMKRHGVDPSAVEWVLLTHLHGDHFGGLPFLVLDGQFSRRERPLTIAGPPGVRARVERAMEVFFPNSTRVQRRFEVVFVELTERVAARIGPVSTTPYAVNHPSGAPSFALRLVYGNRTVAYSGDTEWVDSLIDAAAGADLFIAEGYSFERKIKFHLDHASLERHAPRLGCRRIVLTHMGTDMLVHTDATPFECAYDGMIVTL